MTLRAQHIMLVMLFMMMTVAVQAQDPVADQMLLYQRSIGGWPKQVNNVKVNYGRPLSEADRAGLLDDKYRNDATIDNGATSREIRYLVKAYAKTGNKEYLGAAEKGVRYLLQMQHFNGGFPQFYPDSSSYRNQVTFNDNAMVNALNVLWDVAHGTEGLEVIDRRLVKPSEKAIRKGIACILATQIRVKGKRTGWCAQYDEKTLQPAKARSYELVSLSGMETVGIVEFLMKIEHPSKEVIAAVNGAVEWLKASAIKGYRYGDISDPNQPNGRDRVLQPDPSGIVWARFYDIDTNRPFFCGRDGAKKWSLTEIEQERRTGYGWYGTWPRDLLDKEYPEWKKKNEIA